MAVRPFLELKAAVVAASFRQVAHKLLVAAGDIFVIFRAPSRLCFCGGPWMAVCVRCLELEAAVVAVSYYRTFVHDFSLVCVHA